MNAEEIAKDGFYLVKSVIPHCYRQGWRFLTLWQGFGVKEASREPFSDLRSSGGSPKFCSGRLLVPEQPRRVAQAR